ncbi:hypothetical protein TSUD_330510, partial [Trifolium subterraneum]
MPTILKDRSVFSVLGMCITGTTSNSLTAEEDVDKTKFFDCGNAWVEGSTSVHRQNNCKSCNFLQLDGSLRKSSQSFIGKSNWVVLMFDSSEQNDVGIYRLPKLHHIQCNGLTLSEYDVHVIVYETPSYGAHHFSLCHFGSNGQAKTPIKNPKWIDELHKKQKFIDLDTVILAINCTSAAKRIFDSHVVPRRSLSQLSLFSMSQSCVEYAEKAAMHRHSMWSSLVVDILLGNLVGWSLLYHEESICLSGLNFIHWFATFLRSGCVWLMGNPAGFKLNAELAGVLGILCGFTVPASLIVDMIALGTLHVSTLHWFISIVYSSQIQALAALWRLFRGRKWNPLRQRLDSFDYTVKQHIVGSLLFTPLLLLLPTTSVFYIFFSIVDTTINLFCILIEVTISSNHTASTNSSKESLHLKDFNREKSSILVSILHSNYLSIGKVISPHYRNAFLGVSGSSISKVAHGILIGQRMPYMRGTLLPSPMPWMSLPYK